jgi:ribonuclease Z
LIVSLRSEANHARFLASPLGQGERIQVRGFGASMRQLVSRKPSPSPSPCKGEATHTLHPILLKRLGEILNRTLGTPFDKWRCHVERSETSRSISFGRSIQNQSGILRYAQNDIMRRLAARLVALFLSLCMIDHISAAARSDGMRVTLLGTGTPFPNTERFGSAILVEAAGKKLLFDCGRGVVIRLTQAGLNPKEIDGLFLTHLHSDHVVGIPDVWLSGWVLGRDRPLRIWDPPGTHSMAEHLVQAFAFDIRIRQAAPDPLPAKGVEIDAKEIEQREIYNDGLTRVSAFLVDHGTVKPAFGYRVDSAGHSVVISGDTKFCQNLVDFARGADCLIHVAWSADWKNPTPPSKRSIASAEDAGRVFAMLKPKLGVVYHYKDEEGLWDAVRKEYQGPLVIGKDLMTINVDNAVTWRGKSSANSMPDGDKP